LIIKLFIGGKCSICGEAYDLKPQLLGLGDAMYLGKIVRTYTQGSVIPVTVVVSFEIFVCFFDTSTIILVNSKSFGCI
jgi:hypothetical protein